MFSSNFGSVRDVIGRLRKMPSTQRLMLCVGFSGFVVVVLLGLRYCQYRHLAGITDEMAVPAVAVVNPKLRAKTIDVNLPGSLIAFSDASIFARANGYVKAWYTDIGAHVAANQLMAELTAPDVDAQVIQAQGQLEEARGQLDIASITYRRQEQLFETKVISAEEFDIARTNLENAQGAVLAAQGNLQNLLVLQGYQKIVAPFPGIVSVRNIDIGDLVAAGNASGVAGSNVNNSSNTTSGSVGASGSSGGVNAVKQELFHLVRTDILRVFVYMPQVYSPSVTVDTPAYLQFAEFPGEKFWGKITNIAGALDPNTRTLEIEVQVPNPEGRLFPGAYAEVYFSVQLKAAPYVIPVTALMFQKHGMQVAVVDKDEVIHLKKVQLGNDFGTSIEVTSGLEANDRIVVNPPDFLSDGSKVRVVK